MRNVGSIQRNCVVIFDELILSLKKGGSWLVLKKLSADVVEEFPFPITREKSRFSLQKASVDSGDKIPLPLKMGNSGVSL